VAERDTGDRITLGHGSGGSLTSELVHDLFLDAFTNPLLDPLDDGAILPDPGGPLAPTTFGGQAAMALEQGAGESDSREVAPYRLDRSSDDAPLRIDLMPALAVLHNGSTAGPDAARGARIFHNTLVEAFAEAAALARDRTGLTTVALSGGVLQNRLVHDGLVARLGRAGLRVLVQRQVPPNDGGLSLGQAWAGILADT